MVEIQDTKEKQILAIRVIDHPHAPQILGITKSPCKVCKLMLWVSPITQKMILDPQCTLICKDCLQKSKDEYAYKLSDEQKWELKANGATPKEIKEYRKRLEKDWKLVLS